MLFEQEKFLGILCGNRLQRAAIFLKFCSPFCECLQLRSELVAEFSLDRALDINSAFTYIKFIWTIPHRDSIDISVLTANYQAG